MPSNSTSALGLSKEARDAVKAAFDAMSAWRTEVTESNEKNCKRVVEKMTAAAATLGWPEQIVDASRMQIQSIIEMQIKAIDRITDNWEELLRSPMAASASATSIGQRPWSGFRAAGSSPNGDVFQMTSMAPVQFWMNLAEQWQKSCADAMTFWTRAGKPYDNGGVRGRGT